MTEDYPMLVKNFNKDDEKIIEEQSKYLPKIRLEMQPQHHPEPPLIVELNLKKAKYNMESEYIEGSFRFKEANLSTMAKVKGVSLELIQ